MKDEDVKTLEQARENALEFIRSTAESDGIVIYVVTEDNVHNLSVNTSSVDIIHTLRATAVHLAKETDNAVACEVLRQLLDELSQKAEVEEYEND